MDERQKYFLLLVGFGILCIVLETLRIYSCYQDDCCEIHWLFINKEAICPVFGGLQLP